MNAVRPPHSAAPGQSAGIGDYIVMAVFVFFFLVIFTVAYTFYMCRRSRSPAPPPPATISFVSTAYDETNNRHVIRFSPGVDDDVLVTFPTFVYSEATVTHKGGPTAAANDSGCSICLADYKPADVVRLLPECSHFFHVKCIDMWLKGHPTCPVCRSSVVAGKVPLIL